MVAETKKMVNNLHEFSQFTLFVSSYTPLFFLIIIKQVSQNYNYLNWGGLSWYSFKTYFLNFGLSSVLVIAIIIGIWGILMTFSNIEKDSYNGFPIKVKDVKNKNSEAIGYIATYIIPFLFQSFNEWFEIIAVLFLLIVIYRIYINSSLILINPLLSFRYAIYEIEFDDNGKSRNGLIISRDKYLQEDTEIKIYEFGHKLYYATNF